MHKNIPVNIMLIIDSLHESKNVSEKLLCLFSMNLSATIGKVSQTDSIC